MPTASATPWDHIDDADPPPHEAIVRDAHRAAHECRHRALSAIDEAAFLNPYPRDRCPRRGCGRTRRDGTDAHGVRRWMCRGCGHTFTPMTGTVLDHHGLPVADWVEFMARALPFESLEAMTRGDGRSGTATPLWMAKPFLVLGGTQDGVVPSGDARIDGRLHPLAARDRAGGGAGMGAYPRDGIRTAVGRDDSGGGVMVRAGLGRLGRGRCWDACGAHVAPGSGLVHDTEDSRSVLVERLGLVSEAHRSADLRGLDDEHNPLSRVNHMRFPPKEFMHRRSGFDRDDIDDWLSLFSVIVNPPGDRLEKAAMVLDRAMSIPISLRYRDYYEQKGSSG